MHNIKTIEVPRGTVIARHPWTYARGEPFPFEELHNSNKFGYLLEFEDEEQTFDVNVENTIPFIWGEAESQFLSLTSKEEKDDYREMIDSVDSSAVVHLYGPKGKQTFAAMSSRTWVSRIEIEDGIIVRIRKERTN